MNDILKENRILKHIEIDAPETFASCVREELSRLEISQATSDAEGSEIRIKYINNGDVLSEVDYSSTVILAFDFLAGAAALVIEPTADRDIVGRTDLRGWAAEYMVGYCAFWHVERCDWLNDVVGDIKKGMTSEKAEQTAAMMCARIAIDILAGRKVKRFPDFYLCHNLNV